MDASTEAIGTHVEEWQISAVGGLDPATLVIVSVGIVAAVIWTWLSLDPAHSFKIRLTIVILRALALLLGLGLLLQLSVYKRKTDAVASRLAVVVDVSRSMTRGEDGGRLKQVKKMLAEVASSLRKERVQWTPSWYRFADDIALGEGPEQVTEGFENSHKTDIRGALGSLVKEAKDNAVDGVVLVSDGADTELGFQREGQMDFTWAENLGVPVNTVFVGQKKPRRDLAIERVDVEPFAFTRSETPVAVTLRSVGISDRQVEAFLWQDGKVLQRRTAQLVGGTGHFSFSVFPSTLGQHVLTVTVPVPKDDEVPENNTAYLTFDVIRDKFRILHIAGHPSWDQRFLRETFTSWPKVDLVSFYILRTEFQSSNLGSAGMALIPFPTEDLFEDHLHEFDIVIFHNFEPAAVGVDRYLKNIADFVKQGGAMAVIGGSRGLGGGKMASGELADVFPVKLLPPGTDSSRLFDESGFRIKVTETGTNHPLMRLKPSFKKNLEYWRSFSRLDGVGRVAGVADGAFRLAEHPFVRADDGPSPIIAVKEVEQGRSLAIMTDSLWRLRFTGPMTGGPRDGYTAFWRQVVYWLTRSPDLDRLTVKVEPSPVRLGDAVQFHIALRDQAYRSVPGADVSMNISWIGDDGSQVEEVFNAVLDEHGKFRKEFVPRTVGPHRIAVTGVDGVSSEQRFLVNTRDRELNHLEPNESLMRQLAEVTGGRFSSGAFVPEEMIERDGDNRQLLSHSDIPLWNHPLTILLVIGVLAGEWLVRRKIGLR